MNIVSSSVCLLMTGYLLWILIRRELRGRAQAEGLPEKHCRHWHGYIGGCRRQDFYIKRGWWVKIPILQEGGGGACREKGCFQQEELSQTVSCTVLQAGTTLVSGGTGCPGSSEESWWKRRVKQLTVWNPVPEVQCTYVQIKAICGGGVYWLVQALLNCTSIAPWLLVASLETVQITAFPAKESVGLPLQRVTDQKKGLSGRSFTQRWWSWPQVQLLQSYTITSARAINWPGTTGAEQSTGQVPPWLGKS